MKPLINRFRYENLRNEAHVQFNENYTALMLQYPDVKAGVESLYSQYTPLFEQEKSVLDLIIKSGITDEIEAQDAKRDRIFRGMVDALKSAQNHYNPTMVQMAAKIQIVFNRYGNIAARPADQETAAIDDLCRELKDTQYANQVSQLKLDEWVTNLQQANQTFDQMMMARYSETAQRPTVNMRSARSAVDKMLRAMLDLIEAQVMVNGPEKYTAFIAELNAVMQHYEKLSKN